MFLYRRIVQNIILVFLLVMATDTSLAEDILVLNNAQTFEGKIIKIKNCLISFNAYGNLYRIPASDIYSIEFKDKSDKVYTRYLKQLEVDPGKCVNGRLDAANYHGKKSGHIAMGFLFGPFAMLGTALSHPTPEKGKLTQRMSENSELFNDPEYLECYQKKAKGKLIGAEAIGFGILALMILLITPTHLAGQ
jgi:hypothetical protein